MQPLTVITGVILGSVASIGFGLAASMLVSLVVAPEAPRLAAELGALWRHTLLFVALSVLCGLAFAGLVKRTRWRWYAQAGMWLALAASAQYYVTR